MKMLIETVMSENARTVAIARRTSIAGESALDAQQRAEGEFLRKLIAQLQPMLRESMRSHRILLASDAYGTIWLKSDGIFVHVDLADQEDVVDPLQVLRAEPNVMKLLKTIEADLVAAGDEHATRAADIVHLARYALREETGAARA
jgi:hypothetical protein